MLNCINNTHAGKQYKSKVSRVVYFVNRNLKLFT
jgi:hypothetical protein